MLNLVTTVARRVPLDGSIGHPRVLAGPGGLVSVGSGFGSTTAWVAVLVVMVVLAVVAWVVTRRRARGAGPAVAELGERDTSEGGSS